MKNTLKITSLFALIAGAAFAQDNQVAQTQGIDASIEAVQTEAVVDLVTAAPEADPLVPTFSNSWTGSLSLTGAFNETLNHNVGDAAEKYTESSYLGIGARLSAAQGNWGQSIDIYGSYSGTDETEPQRVLKAKYQVTRGFSQSFYGYLSATANYNNVNLLEFDGFANIGVGYRLLNTPNLTWRVQAGPGYRYSFDQFDVDSSEAGAGAASRIYWQATPTTYLTNDTDLIWSDTYSTVYNDAGVNFKVSDALTTRIGYRLESTNHADSDFENIQKNMTVSAILAF